MPQVLFSIIVFIVTLSFAHAGPPDVEAILAVKRTPCTQGGTVESYISKKVTLQNVRDLGWESTAQQPGVFEVTRTIQIAGLRSPTVFRWTVKPGGRVTPTNGHAMGITKSEK